MCDGSKSPAGLGEYEFGFIFCLIGGDYAVGDYV